MNSTDFLDMNKEHVFLVDEYKGFLLYMRQCSANTVYTYALYAGKFLEYTEAAGLYIGDIGVEDIRCFLFDYLKDKAYSTKRLVVSALISLGKWLSEDKRLLDSNYFDMFYNEKEDYLFLPLVYSSKDMDLFLDSVKSDDSLYSFRDYCIFETMYSCGLRVSEVCNLKFSDIHFDDYWMLVRGKGGKERFAVFGDRYASAIKEYVGVYRHFFARTDSNPYIFLGRCGKKLTRCEVWRRLQAYKPILDDRFRPIHPHTFRHTFATVLLEGGADLNTISTLLGHSSLDTTVIYTHLCNKMLEETHRKYFKR